MGGEPMQETPFEKVFRLEREVERLRGEIKQRATASAERTQMDGQEVARLRAELGESERIAEIDGNEVERLRKLLERADSYVSWCLYRHQQRMPDDKEDLSQFIIDARRALKGENKK
jgi:hypothetical protein